MLGRFYQLLAAQLANVTNDAGARPFVEEPQNIYFEAVDESAVAREGWPLAVISFERAPLTTPPPNLEHYEDIRTRSVPAKDTTAAGTSDLTLAQPYGGNADVTLTVLAGGTVGGAGIVVGVRRVLYNPATDATGAALDTTAVLELDGTFAVGDGSRGTFSAGTLAAGDRWTWQTRAYRSYFERMRAAVNSFRVDLYFAETLADLTDPGGWLDKLLSLFLVPELCADGQFFPQNLVEVSKEELEEKDNPGVLAGWKYTFMLELKGLVWRERREELLGPNLQWQTLAIGEES